MKNRELLQMVVSTSGGGNAVFKLACPKGRMLRVLLCTMIVDSPVTDREVVVDFRWSLAETLGAMTTGELTANVLRVTFAVGGSVTSPMVNNTLTPYPLNNTSSVQCAALPDVWWNQETTFVVTPISCTGSGITILYELCDEG